MDLLCGSSHIFIFILHEKLITIKIITYNYKNQTKQNQKHGISKKAEKQVTIYKIPEYLLYLCIFYLNFGVDLFVSRDFEDVIYPNYNF